MLIIPENFPSDKKILFCCLHWGLGHAARSMPIIKKLIENGNDIHIASDDSSLIFLQNEFPTIISHELPSYGVKYPYHNFLMSMLSQSMKISKAVFSEKKVVKKLVDKYHFDIIISDNRLGCIDVRCNNIYISHQLKPYHENKAISYLFYKMHSYFYNKFASIWVPDLDGKLSGKLSGISSERRKVHFLGVYSRLEKIELDKKFITVILSGPEPQRSILETELYKIIKNDARNFIFIRGTRDTNIQIKTTANIEVRDIVNTKELEIILNQTYLIISRSGYTTLLDIETLGLEAILIPTPGQTEQEYLSELQQSKWPRLKQDDVKGKLLELIDRQVNRMK